MVAVTRPGVIGDNDVVSQGKRAGERASRRFRPILLVLALGVTACVVGWGYLVFAAIDFGSTARQGDSDAWWYLALASLGAVACLFLGLMLLVRITRALGITSTPEPRPPRDPNASSGGRRAAR